MGDGEPTGLDKAYIIVADVTDDPTEPDISQIAIHDVERIDQGGALSVVVTASDGAAIPWPPYLAGGLMGLGCLYFMWAVRHPKIE